MLKMEAVVENLPLQIFQYIFSRNNSDSGQFYQNVRNKSSAIYVNKLRIVRGILENKIMERWPHDIVRLVYIIFKSPKYPIRIHDND